MTFSQTNGNLTLFFARHGVTEAGQHIYHFVNEIFFSSKKHQERGILFDFSEFWERYGQVSDRWTRKCLQHLQELGLFKSCQRAAKGFYRIMPFSPAEIEQIIWADLQGLDFSGVGSTDPAIGSVVTEIGGSNPHGTVPLLRDQENKELGEVDSNSLDFGKQEDPPPPQKPKKPKLKHQSDRAAPQTGQNMPLPACGIVENIDPEVMTAYQSLTGMDPYGDLPALMAKDKGMAIAALEATQQAMNKGVKMVKGPGAYFRGVLKKALAKFTRKPPPPPSEREEWFKLMNQQYYRCSLVKGSQYSVQLQFNGRVIAVDYHQPPPNMTLTMLKHRAGD